MGSTILELVLKKLREAGFTADLAYPGQKYPAVSETVAAVHIERVDRTNQEVTVAATIVSPASLGGTACELEGLKAVEALSAAGAACIQDGCSYDSAAQVFTVTVHATFVCIAEADDCTLGQMFWVYIDDVEMPYVVGFTSDMVRDHRISYEIGEVSPVNTSAGKITYSFRLEELIPAGYSLTPESEDLFELRFQSYSTQETFYGCRWTSVKREFTKAGMRRIRQGFARDWSDERSE